MQITTTLEREAPPRLGKHFYQFYKGREDFFRIVTPFLLSGLRSGEAVFWVVSQAVGVLEAVESLQRSFDISRFIEKGQLLIVPAERWYLERGRFSERKVTQRLKRFVDEKMALGYTHFRGAADLAWLDGRDWSKFQSYETKIDEMIQALEAVALCAYPIQHCSLTQTKEVLEHHDSVFLSKL
ncbi:MAG: MEDS domain-containing protein [Candidatus Omnitrophica bacterium]|nr:MEDS domain-containing protein [Candidatus Omnitrophota bacterium]